MEIKICGFKKREELLTKKLKYSAEKLMYLSPKNVTRRIQRREEKINSLTDISDIMKLQLENEFLNKEKLCADISKLSVENDSSRKQVDHLNQLLDSALKSKTRNQKLKWYYKNIAAEKPNQNSDILESSYECRLEELKNQVIILENEKNEIELQLENFLQREIVTKENGRYKDEIRAVYQDLVCMGVGVNNVEKVVRAVLSNIAGINVDQLPKATFSRIMFTEARGLSQIQVAETLLQNYENDSRILHTDGTSKFGQHYGTYDIVGESGPLVAGLRLMETGDTQTQMNVLNEILTDIESSMENSEHSISKKIVSSIKNVMSDRHIVQKTLKQISRST